MPKRELFGTLATSLKLNAVSEGAELLYLHLLSQADDWGLFDADPLHVKMACFPGRNITVEEIEKRLVEISTIGLTRTYVVEGHAYLAFSIWRQKRFAKKPQYPIPPWGDSHCEWVYIDPRARAESEKKPIPESIKRPPKGNGAANHGSNGFDEFWETYPRRVAKSTAYKVWARIAPDEAKKIQILSALRAQCATADWRREAGKYIPYPATWLNQQRWEDELKQDHEKGRLVI